MGLTWEEVEASAQDRQTWRQRVAGGPMHRRCWMNQVKSINGQTSKYWCHLLYKPHRWRF